MKQFWKRAAVAIVSLALLAGMPPAAGAASDEVEAALASMTLPPRTACRPRFPTRS